MANLLIKLFVTLLLTLYVAQVTHTRHIRSVDDVTQQQQIQQQQDDSTIPPPPPDGGAKSPIEPESPNDDIPKEPKQESTEAPVLIEENRTKADGKMGFGGPPAPEKENPVINIKDVEKVKVEPPGVDVVRQQEGTVETPGGVLSSCRVCPPGFGVLQACSSTADTVCAPCTQGTYSEGYSATSTCRQCSACPLSYYQKTPCVADADVICGACHSHGNGFGNEDFLKQCEGATPPPTTTTPVPTQDVTADVGSGELESYTLEPELIPVKTVLPVVKETSDPVEADVMAIGQPHMGEAKDKGKEQPQEAKGKFQWPILVAAIISGMVFFIVGILASMWCKKVAREQKQKEDMYGEDSVRSTMIRRTNGDYSPSRGSSGYHVSDQATPLNPGK